MLHIGYITPYRITLLVLIKVLCKYKYSADLISKFVILLTKSILNEESIRLSCSEPTLQQVLNEIKKFSENNASIDSEIKKINKELNSIKSPNQIDEFMASLEKLFDDEEIEQIEGNENVVLDKCSVMGLFIRQCRIEYESLPFDRLADISEAFNQYIEGKSGDLQFVTQEKSTWISTYNIREFLKAQAEMIERTGKSNIHPTVLHNYLAEMSIQAPQISNFHQVRYLNYIRTKEYIGSLSNLHTFFDYSLSEGVSIQYSLLSIGILEYKFGHLHNALSALNDALSAARFNKDECCLQEVQYWIESCRQNQSFNSDSSYTDDYLNNMETLSSARNMLREGKSSRHVFELLYKASVNIKMKDIKDMNRVQYLMTSLAWQRYGNSVMAESYQKLADNSEDDAIADIEKTVISQANMFQSMGSSEKALKTLEMFQEKYPTESEFLVDWKETQARIKKYTEKKRKYNMLTEQADILQYTASPYSEEFFTAFHENAEQLMMLTEYEKALNLLDKVYEFIRKSDQTTYLAHNLILRATVYLQTNDIEASIPILIESMTLSKRTNDSKSYYKATIKLSEAYVRTKDYKNIEKAIFMLESIFSKVLLTKSKLLVSDLYLTYSEALDTSGNQNDVLEYSILAENGYRELGMKNQLLRTLHFKLMLFQKKRQSNGVIKTIQEIRNIQTTHKYL